VRPPAACSCTTQVQEERRLPYRKLDRLVQPPAAGGKPRSLVVLLHGLGGCGADVMGLASYWAEAVPHAEFIAPDALEPSDVGPIGFQWFSMQDRSLLSMMRGVAAGAPLLHGFLDEVLAERGLDDSRMALVGVSQGATVALHVGLRRARTPAAIVGYSGMLLAGPELFTEIRTRPPVLLVHGEADDFVPVSVLDAAEIGLRAVGVPVETERRPGLGHLVDEVGAARGGALLIARLNVD
jgi:phospholipase/carboxylesterase